MESEPGITHITFCRNIISIISEKHMAGFAFVSFLATLAI